MSWSIIALFGVVAALLIFFAIVTIAEIVHLGRGVGDPQDRTARNIEASVPAEVWEDLAEEQKARLREGRRDFRFSDIVKEALSGYFRNQKDQHEQK